MHRTQRIAAPVLPGQLQGLQDLDAMAQVEADLMAMAMGTAEPVLPKAIQKASAAMIAKYVTDTYTVLATV